MSSSTLTRIQNNQITDATIQGTKLANNTLTGGLFATNLTLNSNVTILGNFQVSGTPTTINSVNTYINDPLVVFNNGYSGSLTGYNIGMVINRNLSSLGSYGSVNTAFVWVEADGAFEAIATTDTGSGVTSINNSGYANVKVGNLTIASLTNSGASSITGTLSVTGAVTHSSTTNLVGATTFTTATGGGLQSVAIGNVTPGTGAFTTLSATSLSVAALNNTVIGNVTAAAGYFTSLGSTTTANLNTVTTASIQGVIGNVTPAAGTFTTGAFNTATTGGLQAVAIGNVTPGTGVFTTGTFNTATTGGLQAVAIGNVTPGTGAFTTLSATGASTLSTITGASFQGVIGNVAPAAGTFTTGTFTTATTGGLQAVAIGNVTPGTAVFTTETVQTSNIGGLQAVAIGNVTPGTGAFTTASTTGNLTVGGNISITGNIVPSANILYNLGTPNLRFHSLYLAGNTIDINGTTIGADTTGNIAFTTTNGNQFTIVNTAANITVATGNIVTPYVIGNIVATTITASGATALNTVTAASYQGVIGNVTPAAATHTTMVTGGLQAVAIGNVTPGTGAFTSGTFSSTLGVTGATTLTTATTGGLQAVAIGNVTPGTGAFTTLSATGAMTMTTATTGGLQAVAIGNVTPGTGAFTSGTFSSTLGVTGALTFTTATGGGLQAVAIGNVTAGTGAFTTLSASGVTSITNATNSVSSSTGALQVTGGAGIGGDLWVGGNIYVPNLVSTTQSILTVQEPLLYLTGQAPYPYNFDLGFYSHFVGGPANVYAHTGLVRNYVDNNWYLFSNVGEPSGNVVNLSSTALIYDTLKLGAITLANVGNVINTSGSANIAGNTYTGNINAGGVYGNIYGTFYGVVAGGAGAANVSSYIQTVTSSTNASYYPTFVDKSSGNVLVYDNTALTFNPSTGTLSSTTFSGAVSATTITASSTLNVTGATTMTTATTGGLQAVAIGNVTPGTATFTTATTGGLQAVAIGNVTPGTGVFTTGTFNTATTGGLQAVAIGNVTPGTGAFTTLSATGASTLNTVTGASFQGVIGNVTPAAGTFTSVTAQTETVGGLQAVAIGNVTPGTGAFTTGTFSSTLGVTGATTMTTATVGGLQAVAIGNVTPGTGAFTTGTFNTATTGGLQAVAIGNVTPGTGTFTSVTAQTETVGGLQAVAIGNVTPGTGAFTSGTFSSTLGVTGATTLTTANIGGLQATAIGNVTPGTGAFTTLTNSGVYTSAGNIVITSGTTAIPSSSTQGALLITGAGGLTLATGNAVVGGTGYFGPAQSTIGLSSPLIVATSQTNGYTQVQIQNTSSGNAASSDYVATADTGTDTANYIDMGINGSGYSQTSWTISGAKDGYLYVDGGNLTLGTDTVGKTVAIHVGGTYANNIVATFGANSVGATSGTSATAVITGGLGLAGSAGNIYAAGTGGSTLTSGLIVNKGQASAGATGGSNQNAFIVQGVNDSTLVYAKPLTAYDAVIVGGNGASSSFAQGAKLVVNSTDSMLLPVGTSAQRPGASGGTDTAGMLRYSSTAGAIEWYNGSTWASATTAFTIIQEGQFSGTGSQTVFTLPANTTSAGVIISINGVLQISGAGYAYTVSGTTLTFNEAPASGDIIDYRIMTTTATVQNLNSSSGYTNINVSNDNTGIQFQTGTGSAANVFIMPPGGGLVTGDANVAISSANTATTIDSFSAYRSAKYIVQATNGAKYQTMEALVVTDGTTPQVVVYGTVSTNGNLGIVTATASAGTTTIQFIAANASTNVRLWRQYLPI